VISEAADGWLRVLIRSESRCDLFVLWHLPPDVESHLTMVVASPSWQIEDPASPEYAPPWSRLIASGAACSLLYGTPQTVVFPRRAHRGSGVTCVEYAILRGEGEFDVKDATALAKLFKADADPIVVGLGFQALKRLQAFSRHEDPDFYPRTSTDHHWQVVWPEAYEACFRTNIKCFFKRLIRIAHPEDTVQGKRVNSSRQVRKYEFCRWKNNDDEGDDETVQVRFYECIVGH
jgi:hypothetical protein